MFRSIRFRLVASYAALALLGVSLMGVLAVVFVRSHVVRQERDFLQANAAAVARQAEVFLSPSLRRVALQDLAGASAFLGNVRVRVLDTGRMVLADSGDPAAPDEFLWLVPSGLAEADERSRPSAPLIIPLPSDGNRDETAGMNDLVPFLRDLPLGTTLLYASRQFTSWGRRFSFEEQRPDHTAPGLPGEPRTYLTVTEPVGPADAPLAYVELSSPLSFQRETTETLAGAVVFSGLGALAVAVAFGMLIGRTLTDPLRAVSRAAMRMGAGDLAARAPSGRRDEIGDLARSFNAMAGSLESSFRDLAAERDSLRRFVADASHELRTPITALSTFTELLQGPAAGDEAARREFLEAGRLQLDKLRWIVENLLDLSRLDAGIATLALASHDAGDLAAGAAAGHSALAERRGISLEVRRPEKPLAFVCDRQRVELALSNLVANAVKFTQPGGRVQVAVEEVPADGAAGPGTGLVRFSVRDDGSGIDAAELPRIFERFFRGRGATADGAGLGLAIARSVAIAHGGDLTVESAPGAGSLFRLDLPAAQPAQPVRPAQPAP
ncbi:MAG: HAMP domain-containing sensor histidine kinase [Spirochaetes bacterium]|nr:HAMP domain-containing sensor histidine kinase [Spirochaetota bacterium]